MFNKTRAAAEVQPKTVHIGLRVEPALSEAIDALRESKHESRSAVIRRLVLAAARAGK